MSATTSASHPSRHQQPDIEPNKAWKDNLYKTVSETLQSMVDDVKRNYEECLAVAYTEEAQGLVEEEYHRSMKHIRSLAKESFQAQLTRERQERMKAVERRAMQVEQETSVKSTSQRAGTTTTTTINHPSTSIFSASSPSPVNELSSSLLFLPENQPTAPFPPSRGFGVQSSGLPSLELCHQPDLRALKTRSSSTEAHDILSFPTPMTRTPSFRFDGLEMTLRPPDPIQALGLPPIIMVPRDLPPELAVRRDQYISQSQQGYSTMKKRGKGYTRPHTPSFASPKREESSRHSPVPTASEDELLSPSGASPSDSRDSYGPRPSLSSPSSYSLSYDDDEEDKGDIEDEEQDYLNNGEYPDLTDSPSNTESSLLDELEFQEEERNQFEEAARLEEETQHKAGELAGEEERLCHEQEEADPQTNAWNASNSALVTSTPGFEQWRCDKTDWQHRQEAMHQKRQEQFCKEQDRLGSSKQALEVVVTLTKT